MKLLQFSTSSPWTAIFFCSSIVGGLLLRLLFLKYLHHAKESSLKDLRFFCEIYKLAALTDNVETVHLTLPEKREETHHYCQGRTACVDRLNALCMRHHHHAYSILKILNPFQSQLQLDSFKSETKDFMDYIETDALVLLADWKQQAAREFSNTKV